MRNPLALVALAFLLLYYGFVMIEAMNKMFEHSWPRTKREFWIAMIPFQRWISEIIKFYINLK